MPRTLWFIVAVLVLMSCQPAQPAPSPPAATPTQTPAPALSRLPPTLDDFWDGSAHFVVEIANTGLPMGESETLIMPDGEWWSYVHASQRSAGVHDQCGAPVEFPGCVVIYKSADRGQHFTLAQSDAQPATCLFACVTCPCDLALDQTNQQQYPRIAAWGQGEQRAYYMVYEHGANILLRRSTDGLTWSEAEQLTATGIWNLWYRGCAAEESIGPHPFVPYGYDCLSGGPPGIVIEASEDANENAKGNAKGNADEAAAQIYVFVAMGQNPGHLGCFVGRLDQPGTYFARCRNNPLIDGAADYGPVDVAGRAANPYFDFRTLSAAEVVPVNGRYYAFYEGIRGPGGGDAGDTQFGLGLARTVTNEIDGPWEKFGGNPILVDAPGNIGLGHADVVVYQGVTYLYTSLDGLKRSRLNLVWR